MHGTSSIKSLLLTAGIGLTLAACGDSDMPIPTPPYTWTEVSNDMRSTCAISLSCHNKGTQQPFSYDLSLVAGTDPDNYNNVMNAMLVTPATPASSPLITIGRGGMYQGMTHNPSLTGTVAVLWINWVAAGATFP